MNTFSELNAAAAQAPQLSREALCALSDRVQQGDDKALQTLFLTKLPDFCSEFRFQAGVYAASEAFLADCLQRYLTVLRTMDFRRAGESFDHCLSWHIRQAHADFIASQLSPDSGNPRPEECGWLLFRKHRQINGNIRYS